MIIKIPVGPLEANCYILTDDATKDAFVIDPGGDPAEILGIIAKEGLKVRYIVNTHGHFDHVGADKSVKDATGAPVAIHAVDASMLPDAHDHAVIFGEKIPVQPEADMLLEDGEKLTAGSVTLTAIHTPGHTAGGVCLYSRELGVVFTGDTLFAGSIGRTDLGGGSYTEIMQSIMEKLLPLGDDVRILPGHGPESTVGAEKRTNPFITERSGS